MYGTDWEYAQSRLQGTIVRLGGEPIFVHNIRPGMKAEVSKLEDIFNVFIADAAELNLVPVPLGMCNFRGLAHYLSRIPLRRDWRQGLRRENFCSNMGDHAIITPEALAKVIKGEYPTFAEALKAASEGVKSVAWCREWAITNDGKLIYKRLPVGVNKDGMLLLDKEFNYLAEALEEAV